MHDRLSVTLDPRLGAAVRKAAARAKVSLSAWIAEAAERRIQNDLLGRALDEWEAESAPFGKEELDAATRSLGLGRTKKGTRP